uniref:Uncharacterized protein n=1 Tax=Rhizophora mucronata TaxID=61149 RepID=A0A2P2QNB4_RHIMU
MTLKFPTHDDVTLNFAISLFAFYPSRFSTYQKRRRLDDGARQAKLDSDLCVER